MNNTPFTAEQMMAAHKASLDTLFGLTTKAFEGFEKLMELNVQVAKTSMAEMAETTQAALSVKDGQELLALQAGLMQPAAEKAAAYSRHVYDIMAGTQAEVAKVAEGKLSDGQKSMMLMVDSAAKNAPVGSENAVAMMKTAVAAANSAYESINKATKQATEVAEANFNAMSQSAVKASQGAAARTRKTA